jgi:hypothetical protein
MLICMVAKPRRLRSGAQEGTAIERARDDMAGSTEEPEPAAVRA